MGKKKGAKVEGEEPKNTEGQNLLGSPTFKKLENGRYRCVETGHELPAHAKDGYAQTKHCRLGLIDSALARNKPPLNMFRQDSQTPSKLICKLTGDIVNKTEEHIWKHINGKRFLNMLERKEEKLNKGVEKNEAESLEKVKKKKEKKKMVVEEEEEEMEVVKEEDDMEVVGEFWMPPVGDRWDNDDGGDRWGSDSESGSEDGDIDEKDDELNEDNHEDEELSKKTKRMSIEIGPSSFASRKKKKKTQPT